jgi:DNA polymerase-3 subunit delta
LFLTKGKIKLVYYFYGADTFLIEEEVKGLKAETIAGTAMESLNSHTFHAAQIDTAELISEAMTLPAMSPWRFIVVKGAEALKTPQHKELTPYLLDPSPTTCLVFISNEAKVNTSSAFFKLLEKSGYLQRRYAMRANDAESWIRKAVKGAGKDISREAVKRLVEITGNGLGEIRGELDKTILFVGEAEKIEEADVMSAATDVKEENVFELADAIGAKDAGSAIKIYTKLTSEAPLALLGAITRQFRIITKIKALSKSGISRDKLGPAVGVYYYIDKYIQSSSRFTAGELAVAFQKLPKADLEIKGGGGSYGSGLPPKLVITRLIMELCK